MLKTKLIHPQIIAALALCGHGSKVLIADGNYPLEEKSGDAVKVYLGLQPGIPTVTDVLDAVLSVVNVEKAEVMMPENGAEPEIFSQFRNRLDGLKLDGLERYAFYDACMKNGAVFLAISTGEQRTYANILLTVGCAEDDTGAEI